MVRLILNLSQPPIQGFIQNHVWGGGGFSPPYYTSPPPNFSLPYMKNIVRELKFQADIFILFWVTVSEINTCIIQS